MVPNTAPVFNPVCQLEGTQHCPHYTDILFSALLLHTRILFCFFFSRSDLVAPMTRLGGRRVFILL